MSTQCKFNLKKITKESILFFAVIVICFTVNVVSCEDQYGYLFTIKPSAPEKSLFFGYKLQICGDKIIVSEPYADLDDIADAGKVRVYDMNGNLYATLNQYESEQYAFHFGYCISSNTEILVISAEYLASHPENAPSKYYIYTFEDNQLSLMETAFNTKEDFVYNEEVSDRYMYLMDRGLDLDPPYSGMVGVYDMNGNYIRTLQSPDPKTYGCFGLTMETFGDRVFISQYGELDMDKCVGSGYVYVFDEEGTLLMTLKSPEPEERACFGRSIAVSDEYIAIGEFYATVDDVFRAGKVHVFSYEGDHLCTLQSPNPDTSALFGFKVKILGDKIFIGEPNADIDPFQYEGKVHVYNVGGELLQTLTSPDPTNRGAFGWGLGLYEDKLVVSEELAEIDGNTNCGAIHLFQLGASVESQEPVEETTTEIEELESETESNEGISGFQVTSIFAALVLYYFVREWMK